MNGNKNKRFDNKKTNTPTRTKRQFDDDLPQVDENLIYGRNAVMEALKSDRDVEKIFLQKGEREGSITKIFAEAKKPQF